MKPYIIYIEAGNKTAVFKDTATIPWSLGLDEAWLEENFGSYQMRQANNHIIKINMNGFEYKLFEEFGDEVEVQIVFLKDVEKLPSYMEWKYFNHQDMPDLAYLSGMHKGLFME